MVQSGSKKDLALVVNSLANGFELSFYVKGCNLLLFRQGKVSSSYKTDDIGKISLWMKENISYIMGDDPFPLEAQEASAAEMVDFGLQQVTDEVLYEKIQDWSFRHSWLIARSGGFLADVYFRRVDGNMEISWNNENLYKESRVTFAYPKGKACVSLSAFSAVMQEFIRQYT